MLISEWLGDLASALLRARKRRRDGRRPAEIRYPGLASEIQALEDRTLLSIDVGDTIATAMPLHLTLNSTAIVRENIGDSGPLPAASIGDIDIYAVTANAGHHLIVEVTDLRRWGADSTPLPTVPSVERHASFLRLFDSSGNAVPGAITSTEPSPLGEEIVPRVVLGPIIPPLGLPAPGHRLQVTIPQTGTYFLGVSSRTSYDPLVDDSFPLDPDSTTPGGDYRMAVELLSDDALQRRQGSVDLPDFDVSGHIFGAHLIHVPLESRIHIDSFISTPHTLGRNDWGVDDVDFVTVELNAGEYLNLSATPLAWGTSDFASQTVPVPDQTLHVSHPTHIRLFGPDWREIHAGGPFGELENLLVPETGWYHIGISAAQWTAYDPFDSNDATFRIGTVGQYRLTIERTQDPVVTTFLVTNTNDSGAGSLRQAILNANANPGSDLIAFNIGSGGAWTITPLSPLPALRDPGTTIDGTTQPGYAGAPLIEISGQNLPIGIAAIWITGPNATVRGLNVARANGVGVFLSTGADFTRIEDNYIGTDRTGTLDRGNLYQGIFANSSFNTIEDNLISGNDENGIWIHGAGGTEGQGNVVQRNRIGTNLAGTAALGNGFNGVVVSDGAANTLIRANTISGNGQSGMLLTGSGISGNRIQGNLIGTNAAGTAALANTGAGVAMHNGAHGNWIGTDGDGVSDASEGNVISGNRNAGISTSFTHHNVIAGNKIGTNAAGTAAIGNHAMGIWAADVHSTLIGGSTMAARNIISGNGSEGIKLRNRGATNNRIQGNYIGTDVTGTTMLGNGDDGIEVVAGAHGNWIGTDGDAISDATEGNLISGNGQIGVLIIDPGSDANVVAGNKIGVNAAGTAALGNATWGVIVARGSDNVIGMAGDAGRNVVSGNRQGGLAAIGAEADENIIQNNLVGTDVTGLLDLGNAFSGVYTGQGSGFGLPGVFGVPGVATNTRIGGAGVGNVISGNGDFGIWIAESSGTVVQANYIGLGADGLTPIGNSRDGLLITGANNQIGTDGDGLLDEQERNVIAANALSGVVVTGIGASGNRIQGNFIGTNAGGTLDRGNGGDGVLLSTVAHRNIVGIDGDGTNDACEGNLISGNAGNGVRIRSAAFENVVAGNKIGTDVDGLVAVGNARGVLIEQLAGFNRIGSNGDGTSDDFERNLISGNQSYGVYILDSTTRDNTVAGNYIGTDAAGTSAVGNGGGTFGGILIQDASDNTIGGATPALRNVISGNGGVGLWMFGPNATGNRILGNYIGTTADGQSAVPNTAYGIGLFGVRGNQIGSSGAGNVISGNAGMGIWLDGAGTENNSIQGNYIGTNRDGTAVVANGSDGIRLSNGAADNLIGGPDPEARNVISGNIGNGIEIAGASGNQVAGNYVGTDASGTTALRNTADGIRIQSGASKNVIGGLTETPGSGLGNVVSGNGQRGIGIFGGNSNTLVGNIVGLNAAGNARLANSFQGVEISGTSTGNVVGGTAAGSRNVVSGNFGGFGGILISGSQNVVQGNYIGTDITGALDLGNSFDGIQIVGGRHITIGGDSPGAGNVISGNNRNGVWIRDAVDFFGLNAEASDNVVQGNLIGTDASASGALGNSGAGVLISDGASASLIGGSGASEGNRIAFNAQAGVAVTSGAGGASIRGNSIHSNGGLGIDLGNNGVTPNDFLDSDTGPNGLQNFPVLKAATARGNGTTRIVGSLDATPNATFTVDSYVGQTADPSGYGEGERRIGAATVTADAAGHGTFDVTLAATIEGGDFVTATATDTAGNTSEFSGALAATGFRRGGPGDPPGRRDLIVGGGAGDDSIVLSSGSIVVTVNGVDLGHFEPEARVILLGLGGKDTIAVEPAVSYPVEFYGGQGDDVLIGGSGDDLLDGGDGDDLLDGGAGADALVGGPGNNQILSDPTDDLGEFAVDILAPISLTPGSTAVRGQEIVFAICFPDPASTVQWQFSDSQTAAGPQVRHAFSENGRFSVTATVEDSSGAKTTILQHVDITIVAIQFDMSDPAKSALAVGGTLAGDSILFNPGKQPDSIQVLLNGVSFGPFEPTGLLLVYGQFGDDDIQLAGGVAHSAWLYGGDGNDRLKGGAAQDVLIGGDGDDLLIGGGGRDLLVGGNGADRIIGHAGDDILVAGSLQFADSETVIAAIMAEWSSEHDFATRVANLRGTGAGGANGVFYLITTDDANASGDQRTVVDDEDDSQDILTGSAGDDWFFFRSDEDRRTDKGLEDEVFANDLDFILGGVT